MPKLCLIGLVISILVFLLFTLDLVLCLASMAGSHFLFTLPRLRWTFFSFLRLRLIYVSWATFREQR